MTGWKAGLGDWYQPEVRLILPLASEFSRSQKKNIDKCKKYGIMNHVERECWNWQTGTFEGRVFMTYGFKSRLAHHIMTSH